MERWLDAVTLRADTDPVKHMRLAAIQRCRPLVGAELAGAWRDRADRYPDELVGARRARGDARPVGRPTARPSLAPVRARGATRGRSPADRDGRPGRKTGRRRPRGLPRGPARAAGGDQSAHPTSAQPKPSTALTTGHRRSRSSSAVMPIIARMFRSVPLAMSRLWTGTDTVRPSGCFIT